MVFFTCGHCGESLQKPKVAKHYQFTCRKYPQLTCVDCLKDFVGQEYEAHSKCISEDQRYSANGSSSQIEIKKGEKKQEHWQSCVQNLLETTTLKHDEKAFLKVLALHPNLPRKKAKFMNFINNACRQYARNSQLLESVWNLLDNEAKRIANENITKHESRKTNSDKKLNNKENDEIAEEVPHKKKKSKTPEQIDEVETVENGQHKKKKNKKTENSNEVQTEENGQHKNKKRKNEEKEDESSHETEANDTSKRKKKKKSKEIEEQVKDSKTQKLSEEIFEITKKSEDVIVEDCKTKFNWIEVISEILNYKCKTNKILINKLEKRVMKKFTKVTQREASDKTKRKFLKYLNKVPDISVTDDKVLIS